MRRLRTVTTHPTIVQVVHLFVLTAFAVAQPVYDRVGERPAYLSDMGVQPPAIVLFAILFSVILPAILAAGIWAVGRVFPRARAPFHAIVVYILLTLAGAPVVNRLDFLPPWLAIGLMAAAGAGATWGYFRFARARSVVTVAAPAIVIFPAVFLLTSPVARQFFFFKPIIETSRWNPIPVVVVVLDELCGMTLMDDRRDIDAQRFPHFAELARTSTWFRNATTVYPDTWQAVPALLSGRYPTDNWIPSVADRPQNLFSILDATGAYESTAFEPISRLATPRGFYAPTRASNAMGQVISLMPAVGRVLLFHVTPPEMRAKLPELPQLWFGLHDSGAIDPRQRQGVLRYAKGSDRRRQLDHFLNCLDDSPRPQLDFLHVLLPHIPWCYLPSGRKYIAESAEWEVLDDNLVADELFAEQCQQRHLLQLEFADSQIGRLLDRLRQTELYDKCLLIVTADHGVSFKVGEPRRAVTAGNRADIMSVPLFIKTPGQTTGVVSDKNVESVDILPTIADLLGIELQLPVDGRSAFDTSRLERREKTFYETLSSEPTRVPAAILNNSSVPQELRRRFGPPDDPEAMFRIGPHVELVGRQVEDLPTGTGAPIKIALIRSGTVYTQDLDALVPCYFEGRVVASGKLEEPVALAIAVNGVIRATTRTYRFDGLRDRFAAMVPERAFHEGANDVQYYSISGADSDTRLTPCEVIAAVSE